MEKINQETEKKQTRYVLKRKKRLHLRQNYIERVVELYKEERFDVRKGKNVYSYSVSEIAKKLTEELGELRGIGRINKTDVYNALKEYKGEEKFSKRVDMSYVLEAKKRKKVIKMASLESINLTVRGVREEESSLETPELSATQFREESKGLEEKAVEKIDLPRGSILGYSANSKRRIVESRPSTDELDNELPNFYNPEIFADIILARGKFADRRGKDFNPGVPYSSRKSAYSRMVVTLKEEGAKVINVLKSGAYTFATNTKGVYNQIKEGVYGPAKESSRELPRLARVGATTIIGSITGLFGLMQYLKK